MAHFPVLRSHLLRIIPKRTRILVPNWLASVLLVSQVVAAQQEVKHSGYSGQDKLLQCIDL